MPGLKIYLVQTSVLAECNISLGDTLYLRPVSSLPVGISIVAVEIDLPGGRTALMLRLFIPPSLLIANGPDEVPELHTGASLRIVAATSWDGVVRS